MSVSISIFPLVKSSYHFTFFSLFSRLEAQLRNESLHHGDLLQFAFTDDYYNLTLKTVATVRWTALHCSRARFAFKLDDDAYLRVNRLLDTVDRLPSQSQPPVATIFGDLQDTLPVEHNFSSDYRTWAIDRQYWPYQVYPNYTNGMYLLPAGGCDRLYRAVVEPPTTDTIPALPIEVRGFYFYHYLNLDSRPL